MAVPRAMCAWWLIGAIGCGEAAGFGDETGEGNGAAGPAGGGGAGAGASGGTGGSGGGNPAACDALAVELQAALDQTVADQAIPGAAARVSWGACTWEGAAGVANLESNEAMPPGALYRIGSSTKTFVAAALLLEVADGNVSLDQTIDTWAPNIPNAEAITLRQALNHTSGVFNYTEADAYWMKIPDYVWSPEEILAIVAQQEPSFAPGQGWSYSNSNYTIAGVALEAVTGEPIAQAIRTRILDPLGLAETWFDGEEQAVGPMVSSYLQEGQELFECTYYWHASGAWASGAIASSNRDVERFYRALLGGELLAPPELTEMLGFVELGDGFGYGLALMRFPSPLGDAFGHGGDIPGFSSDNRVAPEADAAITQFVSIFDWQKRDALTAALEQVLASR